MAAAAEDDPSRCVMIDDLPHTTRAARQLGLFSLLFGGVAAGLDADAILHDWRALPALLNGRAKSTRC
jgi:beta-phosphoglucomutase-like phosphatase (HAD superfamily)